MAKSTKNKRKNKLKKQFIYAGIAIVLLSVVAYLINNHTQLSVSEPKSTVDTFAEKQKSIKAHPGPCIGNEQDVCVSSPAVDLWPSPQESATSPDFKPTDNAVPKSIGGVITSHSGNTVVIQTTSGRTFTIKFPLDVITWWNSNRASNYDNYKIDKGDTINIYYFEPANKHALTITYSQITSSSMAIKPASALSSHIERYGAN